MYYTVIFCQVERCEFRPAVVEAWVCGVVFPFTWEQVFDPLFGNAPSFEGGVAFSWEGIGVECDKRIGGLVFLKGVVKGDEAREVVCVGYKCRPD